MITPYEILDKRGGHWNFYFDYLTSPPQKSYNRDAMKKPGGFSLIELLVVIVIMGILATISMGTFRTFIGSAQDAKRQALVKSIYQTIYTNQMEEYTNYKYKIGNGSMVTKILSKDDIIIPDNEEYCYFMGVSDGDTGSSSDNEFFVATWSDTKGEAIVDGTNKEVKELVMAQDNSEKFKCNTSETITSIYYTQYKIPVTAEDDSCAGKNKSACLAAGCTWESGTCY